MLSGMEGDKEGIFDIFLHHKMYQPKRAYYCVKILVVLCSRSNAAYSLLSSQPELKANAWHSIQWLKEQTILNVSIKTLFLCFTSLLLLLILYYYYNDQCSQSETSTRIVWNCHFNQLISFIICNYNKSLD